MPSLLPVVKTGSWAKTERKHNRILNTTKTFSMYSLYNGITIRKKMPYRHWENILKSWVGREEKQIASRGEGGEQRRRKRWRHFSSCLYPSLFSWTAGGCLSGQLIIVRASILLATPWQAMQPGREARKRGPSPLNSCPSLTHRMPTHCHNKASF